MRISDWSSDVCSSDLFWWPLGPLLRRLGVIAVDRSAAQGVVEQAAALIAGSDKFWFGLAPEGTRKPGVPWNPGFWKIAKAAGDTGRASCRARGCPSVYISVVAVALQKKNTAQR